MDVRDANILVHSRMAAQYNEREPHFRPENRATVRSRLQELRQEFGGRLLDVGCGTGFIIDLAADLFDDVRGIDLTPAMLARVQPRRNVHVYCCDAASLPFRPAEFDVVSAYSFLHHLEDLNPVLSEVHRVLRPGGCLYADLEPNRYFWQNVMAVRGAVEPSTPALARDEVASVLQVSARVEDEFGIPPDVFDLAEYNKAITGGIDPDEFASMALGIGFSQVEATYEWFAGQGKILHGVSPQAAATVDEYLRQALPLSRGLYKYLRFRAIR
jgi:ubiquinone/menaquinone biosynthesis C-methylase UbiE